MPYSKKDIDQLKRDWEACFTPKFDLFDITIKDIKANAEIFVKSLASLSKMLDSPEVHDINKKELIGSFQNLSLAYEDIVKQYIEYINENRNIEYLNENRSLLDLANNLIKNAKEFAEKRIVKAEEYKENLAVIVSQDAQKKTEQRTISNESLPISGKKGGLSNEDEIANLQNDLIECFLTDSFDINDIQITNSNTKKFINSLARLSQILESYEVRDFHKRGLENFFQNLSQVYTEVIKKYINYAEKNHYSLGIDYDLMKIAKNFVGKNIATANDNGAAVLPEAINPNKAQPIAETSQSREQTIAPPEIINNTPSPVKYQTQPPRIIQPSQAFETEKKESVFTTIMGVFKSKGNRNQEMRPSVSSQGGEDRKNKGRMNLSKPIDLPNSKNRSITPIFTNPVIGSTHDGTALTSASGVTSPHKSVNDNADNATQTQANQKNKEKDARAFLEVIETQPTNDQAQELRTLPSTNSKPILSSSLQNKLNYAFNKIINNDYEGLFGDNQKSNAFIAENMQENKQNIEKNLQTKLEEMILDSKRREEIKSSIINSPQRAYALVLVITELAKENPDNITKTTETLFNYIHKRFQDNPELKNRFIKESKAEIEEKTREPKPPPSPVTPGSTVNISKESLDNIAEVQKELKKAADIHDRIYNKYSRDLGKGLSRKSALEKITLSENPSKADLVNLLIEAYQTRSLLLNSLIELHQNPSIENKKQYSDYLELLGEYNQTISNYLSPNEKKNLFKDISEDFLQFQKNHYEELVLFVSRIQLNAASINTTPESTVPQSQKNNQTSQAVTAQLPVIEISQSIDTEINQVTTITHLIDQLQTLEQEANQASKYGDLKDLNNKLNKIDGIVEQLELMKNDQKYQEYSAEIQRQIDIAYKVQDVFQKYGGLLSAAPKSQPIEGGAQTLPDAGVMSADELDQLFDPIVPTSPIKVEEDGENLGQEELYAERDPVRDKKKDNDEKKLERSGQNEQQSASVHLVEIKDRPPSPGSAESKQQESDEEVSVSKVVQPSDSDVPVILEVIHSGEAEQLKSRGDAQDKRVETIADAQGKPQVDGKSLARQEVLSVEHPVDADVENRKGRTKKKHHKSSEDRLAALGRRIDHQQINDREKKHHRKNEQSPASQVQSVTSKTDPAKNPIEPEDHKQHNARRLARYGQLESLKRLLKRFEEYKRDIDGHYKSNRKQNEFNDVIKRIKEIRGELEFNSEYKHLKDNDEHKHLEQDVHKRLASFDEWTGDRVSVLKVKVAEQFLNLAKIKIDGLDENKRGELIRTARHQIKRVLQDINEILILDNGNPNYILYKIIAEQQSELFKKIRHIQHIQKDIGGEDQKKSGDIDDIIGRVIKLNSVFIDYSQAISQNVQDKIHDNMKEALRLFNEIKTLSSGLHENLMPEAKDLVELVSENFAYLASSNVMKYGFTQFNSKGAEDPVTNIASEALERNLERKEDQKPTVQQQEIRGLPSQNPQVPSGQQSIATDLAANPEQQNESLLIPIQSGPEQTSTPFTVLASPTTASTQPATSQSNTLPVIETQNESISLPTRTSVLNDLLRQFEGHAEHIKELLPEKRRAEFVKANAVASEIKKMLETPEDVSKLEPEVRSKAENSLKVFGEWPENKVKVLKKQVVEQLHELAEKQSVTSLQGEGRDKAIREARELIVNIKNNIDKIIEFKIDDPKVRGYIGAYNEILEEYGKYLARSATRELLPFEYRKAQLNFKSMVEKTITLNKTLVDLMEYLVQNAPVDNTEFGRQRDIADNLLKEINGLKLEISKTIVLKPAAETIAKMAEKNFARIDQLQQPPKPEAQNINYEFMSTLTDAPVSATPTVQNPSGGATIASLSDRAGASAFLNPMSPRLLRQDSGEYDLMPVSKPPHKESQQIVSNPAEQSSLSNQNLQPAVSQAAHSSTHQETNTRAPAAATTSKPVSEHPRKEPGRVAKLAQFFGFGSKPGDGGDSYKRMARSGLGASPSANKAGVVASKVETGPANGAGTNPVSAIAAKPPSSNSKSTAQQPLSSIQERVAKNKGEMEEHVQKQEKEKARNPLRQIGP